MKVLITGGAGFIGSHVSERFISEGWSTTVIDNLDSYYDPKIKQNNIKHLLKRDRFTFLQLDICDYNKLLGVASDNYDLIIHLAARAGVRDSDDQKPVYTKINVLGTKNVLSLAKHCSVKQFIFASSSSVYGDASIPWSEANTQPSPKNHYAETKLKGEQIGKEFALKHDLRFIALRFFNVFGPRQRPESAFYNFISSTIRGTPITLYGNGNSSRDYTYIDDLVEGIYLSKDYSDSDFEIFNLGSEREIYLHEVVECLQSLLGRMIKVEHTRENPNEIRHTLSNCSKARKLLNYNPKEGFKSGLRKYFDWFLKQNQMAFSPK